MTSAPAPPEFELCVLLQRLVESWIGDGMIDATGDGDDLNLTADGSWAIAHLLDDCRKRLA